jgi:hypothetical protein
MAGRANVNDFISAVESKGYSASLNGDGSVKIAGPKQYLSVFWNISSGGVSGGNPGAASSNGSTPNTTSTGLCQVVYSDRAPMTPALSCQTDRVAQVRTQCAPTIFLHSFKPRLEASHCCSPWKNRKTTYIGQVRKIQYPPDSSGDCVRYPTGPCQNPLQHRYQDGGWIVKLA